MATSVASFLDVAGIDELLAIYVFDYGAPTGFRLALERPNRIKSIISQNGNAYEEGLLPFWDPLRKLWAAAPGSAEEQDSVRRSQTSFLPMKPPRISTSVVSHSLTRSTLFPGLSIMLFFNDQGNARFKSICSRTM